MLMILARLVRSESFWAVAKVRSPHTGPGIRYIIYFTHTPTPHTHPSPRAKQCASPPNFRRDVDHSSGTVLSVAALDAHRGARRGRMTRGEKAEILARWETCAT